jgi:hypothetical protein
LPAGPAEQVHRATTCGGLPGRREVVDRAAPGRDSFAGARFRPVADRPPRAR